MARRGHGEPSQLAARPGRAIQLGRWATRLRVTFDPKGAAKCTVAVAHERLPDASAAEQAKAAWKARLADLKSFLEPWPQPVDRPKAARRSPMTPNEASLAVPKVLLGGLAYVESPRWTMTACGSLTGDRARSSPSTPTGGPCA
jgi:hypothetical protein